MELVYKIIRGSTIVESINWGKYKLGVLKMRKCKFGGTGNNILCKILWQLDDQNLWKVESGELGAHTTLIITHPIYVLNMGKF